ncbi:HWE histidine kinase domain-containing protein [uncultured Ferrovibrio sp.]|jgi:two-component sensor histidine kinase|uniref:sensor histidine kinase n=1 Tax=uncultured Ferrovibrio sp. TaxID=1576913 RepID=UPI002606129B|nr:HWE histidine kinase domain-containing protein [uncultured Ferrovibrio sp.]
MSTDRFDDIKTGVNTAGALTIDFRAVFDHLPTPHLLMDANLEIVEMNRAYLQASMRNREDLIGLNVVAAFPIDDESRERLYESLMRTREYGVVDVITLPPHASPRPAAIGGGFEHRYWSYVHTPIRNSQGEIAFILQQIQDVTDFQRLKDATFGSPVSIEPLMLGGDLLLRAEAVQAVNQTLLAEHSHLRRLFMQAPGIMCVLSGPDLVFELVNNACLEAIGYRDVIGLPIREALPEIIDQGHVSLLETVMTTGQPFVGQGMRIALQRKPDEPPEERYFDLVYQPITGSDGSVSGIFVAGVDITDRILAQEQQRLLMDELNHRVKNTLATVQAIVTQTLRSGVSPEQFAETFQARLMALSRTHNALTRGQWQGAELREILREEVRPYGESRIELRGPPVRLPPRAALSLGMIFHELAVNAAKYGALSTAQGRLKVTWQDEFPSDGNVRLNIEWREENGPPVAQPPQRKGFGSRLIERSITGELNGELSMEYGESGLVCRFSISLWGHSA